jgi:uncharacterized protein (DUF305 family)
MNKKIYIKIYIYSLTGLLMSSALTGLLLTSRTQAQSTNPDHNLHHPDAKVPAPQSSMMTRPDQYFIEMMIPHHQDAVEMANLALTRAKHPEIKQLAEAINRDQTREIQQMRAWYKAWYGKEVPQAPMGTGMMGNRQGMGQGMSTQNGMMHTDLAALKNATDFDKEFLRQMIPHHQMAVHMAQMVLNQKTRPEIRTLAQSIIKSQTAEIKQMQQWQKAWYR